MSTAPEAASEAARRERLERNDQNLSALVGRFMERAATLHRDAKAETPAPARSPIAVRLGWYIPPRHEKDTLESYRPQTPSQRIALDATRAWVDSVKRGEGGALALLGDVGTGKSHLMFAAIRAVNEANIHAAAWGWYDLARLLREAKYNPDPEVQSEACRQRDRLFAAKAFGIDEIRPTSGTDFDVTELAQLMTRAYRECQGVIVTSNAVDRQLIEIIGRAAASRLTPVKIIGPDLRKPENRHLRAI
jgi:DNA replication protein DnaC